MKGLYIHIPFCIKKCKYCDFNSFSVCHEEKAAYLNALFTEYRLPNVFISGYGSCHIDKEAVSCDYFEFLEAKEKPMFFGQYMFEYSWAEETAALLEMQMQQSKYKQSF